MDGKTIGLVNESIIKNNLINLKNIVFEVTEKCNLCCKYCGLSERLYEKAYYKMKYFCFHQLYYIFAKS